MDMQKDMDEASRREAEATALRAKRYRSRLISHTIAGAATFAFFHMVSSCAGYTSASGLALGCLILGGVGAVAGFIISYQRLSMAGGAMVGSAALFILPVILAAIGGTLSSSGLFFYVAGAAIGGGTPGALIGLHSSMDYRNPTSAVGKATFSNVITLQRRALPVEPPAARVQASPAVQ